ncbi:MAG: hypothetical protein ABJD97_21660 [Betaproteobacteria bacterium]
MNSPIAPARFAWLARRRGALVVLAMVGACAAARAQGDADEAFYQRAAACAAAMQFDQLALVAKARGGTPGLRPELLTLTRLGFAYVGTAYLKGLRDPRGSDMLKAATAEQKGWPAARHAALVAECRVEAQKVYEDAGSMSRWLVDKKAVKRVDKFLAVPAAPASAASR